jgi:hypothetical protein
MADVAAFITTIGTLACFEQRGGGHRIRREIEAG